MPGHDLVDALSQLKVAVPKLLADLRLAHDEVYVSADAAPAGRVGEALGADARRTRRRWSRARRPIVRSTPTARQRRRPWALRASTGCPWRRWRCGRKAPRATSTRSCGREGRPTPEVLAEALAGLVAGIKIGKTMRWNASGVAFSRPIRWFVSLLGETVIPFEYAGLTAGRTTYGPRAEGSPELEIAGADAYLPLIAAHHIIVDRDARQAAIKAQVAALAAEVGGVIPHDPGLLDEVTDLVEQPTAIRGNFAEEYPAPAERRADHGDEEAPAVLPGGRCRGQTACPTSSRCATAAPNTPRSCRPATRA